MLSCHFYGFIYYTTTYVPGIILVSEHYEMVAGVSLSVRLSVATCPDLTREQLPTERSRKLKIGRMDAHHTGNLLRGQKVKGHQAD